MQKRRHLETSFQQTDPCCTSEAQPHAFLLSGPASPGNKKLNKWKEMLFHLITQASVSPHWFLKNIYKIIYDLLEYGTN